MVIKKSFIYYSFVACYIVACFSIIFLSFNRSGLKSFVIESDSMRPTIKKGSLVFTVKQKYYFPGDIITFYDRTSGRELIITHRIYRIGGNVYLTKGDANIAIDKKPVLPRLIIGRVFLIIPFLGYFVSIIKNPIGTIFFILLPAIMIIANELKKIKIYLLD